MKKKTALLCCLMTAVLICATILPRARAEEDVITVNPASEPLTREETLEMAEQAAAAFYADQDLRDELASEITLEWEDVPAENYPTQNTSAVRWVSQYTRNPAPEKLVWDLSTRAGTREKDTFFWLEVEPDVSRGVITAAFDAETNTITVEAEDVDGDFAILFHPALADVARPVTVRAGDAVRTVRVNPSEEFLKASILENGDPALACVGRIMYSEVVSPEGSME